VAQGISVSAGQSAADGPDWTHWSTCSESLALFWPYETARDAAAWMAEAGDTPQFRSQRGRLGAYVSWVTTEDRPAPCRLGERCSTSFEKEVDPEGKLTVQERENAHAVCREGARRAMVAAARLVKASTAVVVRNK
jgi:hypothetical protein